MAISHELKEGTLTFTPAHGEGGELSLLVTFTSNGTGVKYEQLLSCADIQQLSMKREDGTVRMYTYEFMVYVERFGECSDTDNLRMHNQALTKRIDKLEFVISALATQLFKKEHIGKSREGEISHAEIQLLVMASVDLSSFGYDWLCEIAKAAVRAGSEEICPAIIAAAKKMGVNASSKKTRETLMHAIISEAGRAANFSIVLTLVNGLIAYGADPQITCGKCSAISLVDGWVVRHERAGIDESDPTFADIRKIQALMRGVSFFVVR